MSINITVQDGDGSVGVNVQDGTGAFDITIAGGDAGRASVSDSGTTTLANPSDLNFDANLDVFDDGDGTVTIDAASGSGFPDAEDDGSVVVSGSDAFNFSNNLTVTDDGDGSVTVDASGSQPDAEDGGTVVVSGSSAFNFGTDLSVTDDGDGTVTVDATGSGTSLTVQDDGTNVETDVDTLDFQTDFASSNPNTGEAEISLDSNSVTVAGNSVSLGGSTGVDYQDLANTAASFPIPNGDLSNSSLTVAGNSVSLGSSTTVDYVDLNDTGSSFPIPNSDLSNSSVTVANQSVSLGGSTTIAVGNLSDVDTATLNAGEVLIYNATANQFENADISAGNALTATTGDASITLAVASGSIDSNELVNDSVTVANNTVSLGGSTTVSIDNLSDVASSTESAGEIPIWDSTATEYQNAALTGGNAISVTNADASITLDVPTDSIQSDEIDQSQSLSWTATQIFSDNSIALDIDDQAGDPTANGEITRNGTDVKIYSGGSVRNVSNIGSGGGASELSDLSDADVTSPAAGQSLLYHATNSQFENAQISAGNALSATAGDASLTLDVDSNSIDSAELVNDSITVAGNSVSLGGSTAVSADDLSDIATSTESAGQLLLWHGTNNQYENANLSAGNALSATTGDASLTLDVDSNSIDSSELVNDSVTVAGNSVSLGGSTTVSIDDLSDVASSTESAGQVPIWDATDSQYENATLTGGSGISITNADASITVGTNLGNGVELDGSDNIRVNGGTIAGNVLSEDGTNPYQINLSIGNGIEDNSGTLRVNPAGFAGDGLKETSATTLGVEPADFAGTLLSDDGSDNLQVDESNISHDAIDQTTVDEDDHHVRGGFARSDVTSQSVTASAWDSLWVDTSAAGGNVTVTLPADGDTSDGDRVEVGVEDATNDTDVTANTGQSIIGSNPSLTTIGDTVTMEYKSSNSTWMVR